MSLLPDATNNGLSNLDYSNLASFNLPSNTLIKGIPITSILGGVSTFDIRAYGAVPNTDCTAAIAAAYLAAVNAGGGIVFIPQGTWLYSATGVGDSALYDQPGSATTRGIMFKGVGQSSILKQAGAGTADFAFFYGTNITGITFEDIQWQGNNVAFATATTRPLAIHFEASAGIWINRCTFYQSQGFGMVYINNSSDVWVDDSIFSISGQGRASAKFMPMLNFGTSTDKSERVHIRNCSFYLAHFHAIWLQANNSQVIGCSFLQCGETRVVNAGLDNIISNNLDKNGWQVSVSGQFIESFSDNMTACDNRIIDNGQTYDPLSTGNLNCIGIFSAGGNAVINGNTIKNNKAGGITMYSATGGPYPTASGQNVACVGNTIVGNDTALVGNGGILLGGDGTTATNLNISQNSVSGNGGFDMKFGNAYDPLTTNARGNSCWPDAIGLTPTSLGGDTNLDLMGKQTIKANAMMNTAAKRALMRGLINTTTGGGTMAFHAFFGGHGLIKLGGTWQTGDIIVYHLAGSIVTYVVAGGPLSSTAAATALAAAINADGTVGPLVTATASGATVATAAKAAMYATTSNYTHSLTVTSTGGTGTLNGALMLASIFNFTTGASIALAYRLELTVQNTNIFSQTYAGSLIIGTAVSKTVATTGGIDTTIDQDFSLYGALSNAADATSADQLQFERAA